MKQSGLTTVWSVCKQLDLYWWRWAQRCSFGMMILVFGGSLQTALPAEQSGDFYSLLSWLLLTVLLWLPLLIAIVEVMFELLTKSKSKVNK
ncbi:hypothetical protein [Fructobacillus tropaeoli]|uniref:Uncharacterized protein n=1 Tax=Fructobacillus tropaeoli TaxID=709323 RepID=A0A3F3H590_9LACO|nr:hypothetical protein [Fructobacillus tropaeoli]GAP04812.1 hypothetical protein FTRO_0090130 [Fructobacillus tropaeoli]